MQLQDTRGSRSRLIIAMASSLVALVILAGALLGKSPDHRGSTQPSAALPDSSDVYDALARRGWVVTAADSSAAQGSTAEEAEKAARASFGFTRGSTVESVALVDATIKNDDVQGRTMWLVHLDNVEVPLFGAEKATEPGYSSMFVLVDPRSLEVYKARTFSLEDE